MPTPESVKRAEELLDKLETNDVANSKGFANWDFITDQIAIAIDQTREEAVRELVASVEKDTSSQMTQQSESRKRQCVLIGMGWNACREKLIAKAREMGVNVTDL